MKIMNKRKGFTLVELLVVISVIGILTTIVLTALTKSRDEAKETAILAEVRGLYQQAELHYLDSFNYSTEVKQPSSCPTSVDTSWGVLGSQKGVDFINGIVKKAGAPYATCAVGPESWAISVDIYNEGVFAEKLIVNTAYAQESSGFICFDSSENVKTSSNTITLDSNGDARQDPVSPGIGEESPGFFSCL